MKVMIYDFETSGLPLFKEPSESEGQPHICEVAALVFDDFTKKLEKTMHYVVRQNGWEVHPEAFKAHGITPERSFKEGVDEVLAVQNFYAMQALADVRVAHNEQFDQRIARIGLKRFLEDSGDAHRDAICDAFKARAAYCTMKNASPILNLPSKKPPSLAETYQHFFGEMFEGAHGAMADAKACARIYFKMTQDHDIGWLDNAELTKEHK